MPRGVIGIGKAGQNTMTPAIACRVSAAARADKHVFCGPPLATNVPDAIGSVRACAEAGLKLGVNFHDRHFPRVQDVSRLVVDGAGTDRRGRASNQGIRDDRPC